MSERDRPRNDTHTNAPVGPTVPSA